MSAKAILNEGVLKSISRRHPWIFSGAIKAVKGNPEDGDILKLVASNDQFLGRGYWNSKSQIQVRVLSWDEEELIDHHFWHKRLLRAIESRPFAKDITKGCRLVNAENDFLPGLVVDRYGEWLVLQALTLGIERRKTLITELLVEMLQPKGVYERSDVDVRKREGLDERSGVLWGETPPSTIEIEENGLRLLVDIQHGHKTGFYLDQQVNRAMLAEWIAHQSNRTEMTVLNTFSYTGAFSIAARAAGAGRAISLDSSADALEIAKENYRLNGLVVDEADFVEGDVFAVLRQYREQGQKFDVIILDPPKFAQSAKQVERAARGYKDINLLAFQLLNPGGWLWTFSCSNAIHPDLFQKIVFGALEDSKREAQIVQHLHAAPDHPIALTFPEGEYLKGLVCRVW
ncbi:MAG: 23S rRNA (cytosine(1962)-C(5))-methyltransferase RlmI [Chloroflexi bacterium]|nr:23S rRNA (cytosine(1962)-C(5))-methyltransferase RlmI [Chloroflexota bacterium]